MENTVKITQLDERMKQVNQKLDGLDKKIDKEFKEIKEELKCYVRHEEFTTVKNIVYGMVGAILTAFVGSLIYLVFK